MRTKMLECYDIAIIGLSFEFPGTNNLNTLWNGLLDGRCFYHNAGKTGKQVAAWGSVQDIHGFDYSFFDYSYKEACYIDPQQRLLLQHSWSALENAGYMNINNMPIVCVYASASINRYRMNNLSGKFNPDFEDEVLLGNTADFLATRIAYKLGLQGPALNIQSGCSSSLSSLHTARIALLTNQCDIALVGAVSLSASHDQGYEYLPGGIRSANGQVRAFDIDASGTVFTNGVAVVILKKLINAKQDGDQIFGIISSSAVNNDGNNKASFTAPTSLAQTQVITKAMKIAKVKPEDFVLIETHGTGTLLGDIIEFSALQKVFFTENNDSKYCAMQTIKANIGHLDTASGLAGLIKAALVLKYKKLPPQINFAKANSKLDIANSPFFINTTIQDMSINDSSVKYAGVTALGIGGTNAHVILRTPTIEEINNNIPLIKESNSTGHIVLLSAKSQYSFDNLCKQYQEYVQNTDTNIASVSYTTIVGRTPMKLRKAICANSILDLAQKVKEVKPNCINNKILPIAFLFPGQGAQYHGMGKDLYNSSEIFRSFLDKNLHILSTLSNKDLTKILFISELENKDLYQTQNTQPILFAFEVALSEYLQHLNIRPSVLLGHSLGEYTSLVISKALEFTDAAKLVLKRAELMAQTKPGSMISVMCNKEVLGKILPNSLDIAAWNGPNLATISGNNELIADFRIKCEHEGIITQLLPTKHAFHSRSLIPIVDKFKAELEKIVFNKPIIPIISNLDGKILSYEQLSSPEYWIAQMLNPVEFVHCIEFLQQEYNPIFLEVGPGITLKTLTQNILSDRNAIILNTLPHPKDSVDSTKTFQKSLSVLWEYGYDVAWLKIFDNSITKTRLALPTYSFDLEKCWVSGTQYEKHNNPSKIGIYRQFWRQSSYSQTDKINLDEYRILVLERTHELQIFIQQLQAESKQVIIVYVIDDNYQHSLFLLDFVKACENFDQKRRIAQLYIITHNSIALQNDVIPQQATLQSQVKVINQEKALFQCKLIDVESNINWWEAVLREISYNNPVPVIALRNGERFIENFELMEWLDEYKHTKSFNDITCDDGSIIILGGTGHIAFQYAKFILNHTKYKVFLVQRSPVSIIDNPKRSDMINYLKKIAVDRVFVRSADIGHYTQLYKVCEEAIEIGGKIHTLIHAAGVDASMHYRLMKDIDQKFYDECFYTKHKGLQNIKQLAEYFNISHCHIVSSISSILGGIGMFVYGSLHTYIDNFVLQQQKQNKIKWTAINWEAWDLDTNTEEPENFQQGSFGDHLNSLAIKPEVGYEIISQLWHNLDAIIIVSSTNLTNRYNNWVLEQFGKEHNIENIVKQERPEMQREYIAPRNNVERELCNIWSNILAIKNIGVHDNFFELGGHSLMALQMVNVINKNFHKNISIVDLFQYVTIEQLAQQIDSQELTKTTILNDNRKNTLAKNRAARRIAFSYDKTHDSGLSQ